MGTTLTGTTPATTYDSLIKVTDNGPLSGTAKYLSDGLGNDSALAVSTANVGVGIIPSANIGNLQIGGTANASLFSQQGTDTVRAGVRASGRVGIVFDSSDATYTNRMWYLDSVGANGSLTIGRQGLDVMTFANAGNVGIGTASPSGSGWDESSRILHLYQNNTSGALLRIQSSNTTAILNAGNNQLSVFTTSAADIRLGTLGSERMRITSAGLVGIGTSAPQSILDVRKLSTNFGTTSELGLLISNTGVGGQYAQIGFGYSEATCAAVIGGVITSSAGATNSALVFGTRSSTVGSDAPTERMRITSAGEVGIGTDSPTEPLHVNGDARATNLGVNFAAQSDARIFVYDNSTNSGLVIQQDSASGIIAKFNGSGGATKVRIDADGLKFGSDTAAANALDDYEEGTWTPSASGLTLNYTVTTSNGHYTKIGNKVTVTWEIAWTSVNVGGAGTTFIPNLPFTSKANSFATAPIWIESTAAADQFIVYNDPNSTNLYVAQHTSGSPTTNSAATIWGATNRFFGSITYLV